MKKRKSFWIARDSIDKQGYNLGKKKLKNLKGEDGYVGISYFCVEEFEAIVGIKLQPGEQGHFRITEIEEIK